MRKYQLGCPAHSTSRVLANVERQLDALAHQFVDDRTVVDALDLDLAAVFVVVELAAALDQRHDIDDRDSQFLLRDQEIGQRLLVLRIDLHQDDVFGIVLADDQLRA